MGFHKGIPVDVVWIQNMMGKRELVMQKQIEENFVQRFLCGLKLVLGETRWLVHQGGTVGIETVV